MLGCYDFCGHYEWTFGWLERTGSPQLVQRYWEEAIYRDSQRHAREQVQRDGFDGMAAYWGHTLAEESPSHDYTVSRAERVFRIDMHDCPSRGFLLRNGLAHYDDYCDHCLGWIGPLMGEAGFVVHHEHNHRGQCWWEMERATEAAGPSTPGTLAGAKDVRTLPGWSAETPIDRFIRATAVAQKARGGTGEKPDSAGPPPPHEPAR